MVPLMFGFILGLVISAGGAYWLGKDTYNSLPWACVITGVLVLGAATFAVAPIELTTGLPMTSIRNGTHKVAFVYVSGENVNIGIEEKGDNSERLYLYQFPKSAFDSNTVKTDGKELSVIDIGGFKKLVLK